MGNITGNPFDPEVVDQINIRQKFLGANPKQDKHLIYQNNKTSFLRLASSIKIKGDASISPIDILAKRGISSLYVGDDLAKASVLFGGTVDTRNNKFTPNYGLKELFDINNPFNGAYGWGGIQQQGYRPMPAIESANISFYNRGALAKADIKIKVFTVEQLQVFDLLYLRIGYSMLLEWGHNVYVDNNENLQNRDEFFTKPFEKFFTEGIKQNDILDAIKAERKKTAYNYDAMLGKITNFTWKFNPDGSYDIDLHLIGYGDLIESLKINTSSNKKEISFNQQLNNDQKSNNKTRENLQTTLNGLTVKPSMFDSVPSDNISLEDFNNKFIKLKENYKKYLNTENNKSLTTAALASSAETFSNRGGKVGDFISEEWRDLANYLKGGISTWEGYASNFRNLLGKEQSTTQKIESNQIAPQTARENKDKTIFNTELYKWISELKKNKQFDLKNFCSVNFKAKSEGASGVNLNVAQYYVRLGYLLDWMEKNLLVYDETKPKDKNNNYPPLFNFDTDSETNFCKRFPYQISSDPFICLIPIKNTEPELSAQGNTNTNNSKGKTETTGWNYFTTDTPGPNLSAYFVEGNSNIGKVMNIFVNIDFIAKTLEQGVDSNGKSNLLTFLSNLLNGINDSLGNVNKLEAQYDNETNLVKIIEGSKLDINSTGSVKIATFESYGVKVGTAGSFLTNVDFQVQLPPNMAAMATISAQAKGNIPGENATGLSKLNKGIVDRIVTTKLGAESLGVEDKSKIFTKQINVITTYLKSLYKDLSYQQKNIDTLKSINRDVSLYTTGEDSINEKTSSPFFIPFNLSLEMDGLSGMKNYERFSITEQILPYSYRPNEQGGVIDFLIKGVSHTISNNQWKTKIESLTVSSTRKK
jgi:hypothetical protein